MKDWCSNAGLWANGWKAWGGFNAIGFVDESRIYMLWIINRGTHQSIYAAWAKLCMNIENCDWYLLDIWNIVHSFLAATRTLCLLVTHVFVPACHCTCTITVSHLTHTISHERSLTGLLQWNQKCLYWSNNCPSAVAGFQKHQRYLIYI